MFNVFSYKKAGSETDSYPLVAFKITSADVEIPLDVARKNVTAPSKTSLHGPCKTACDLSKIYTGA